MVKFVVFHVGLHVHVSEICPNKIPKRLTSLESQYVFIQILEAAGDCFQPTPPRKFRKEMVHIGHIFM